MELLSVWILTALIGSVVSYCKPNEECWPTEQEISAFEASLTTVNLTGCLPDVPTFTSADKQGPLMANVWYEDRPETITPFLLMNLRTYVEEGDAYFVVLARSPSDVQKSVKFAVDHNLAVSIMSTGHEFQDRNSNPGETGLLIRTTCLRDISFDLSPDNKFGHEDGYVRLGSGFTWGSSKFNMMGVQEYAEKEGRVVVSGHAPNVGIVGWSLGGGHGQLVPLHGMGVDQILEVDLVTADGSMVTTNELGTTIIPMDGSEPHTTKNADLFWALKGGGGSTWGAITSMTLKVHKPRNSCSKGCYIEKTRVWGNKFAADDTFMAVVLVNRFLTWSITASKYWSGYANIVASGDSYAFIANVMYVGTPEDGDDINSFDDFFKEIYPDNLIDRSDKTFDTFFQKLTNQDSSSETVFTTFKWFNMLSGLIGEKEAQDFGVAKGLVDNWIPRCYRLGTPCTSMVQFVRCLPKPHYDESGLKNNSLSSVMQSAVNHIYIGDIISLTQPELSFEEKSTFIHETLAPELYTASSGSYFSESEYTMTDWQTRFWGQEVYEKLVAVKKAWDPSKVFGCRHCIGDGIEAQDFIHQPWRMM